MWKCPGGGVGKNRSSHSQSGFTQSIDTLSLKHPQQVERIFGIFTEH